MSATATNVFANTKEDQYHFHIVDYAVFGAMLLLSALTGLYFGCRSRYCKSMEAPNLRDYLIGNGNMKPFPVAMSLVASYISGVTILGTPSEIYRFGTQYCIIAVAICLSGTVVATVYLPVFCKLQLYSSYEYLELRFNRIIRTVASVLFVMDEIMFLPILVYVPSLAFNQVTGIDLHLTGTVVSVICIFYTVLGGIKAVVWTDTWQILVMFIAVVVVVILGTITIGGPAIVWNLNDLGGRLIISNFTPNMYERHTVLSVVIGGFFYWTSFNAVNQMMVQRYLALPNKRQSQISVTIFTFGVTAFVLICCFSGMLVYATYHNCDPLEAGRIKAYDQLLPLFVMETVGHLRGVPGLFIAGVFGAALSSLSVALNSTSTVFLEDFVKGCLKMKLSEKTATLLVKTVTIVLGIIGVACLYVVEHMGGVLALAASLSAIAAGTTFGVFSLGMLVPWANSTGALIGVIAGAIMSGLVSYGGQYVAAANLVVPHQLPVSVDKCDEFYGIQVNATTPVYPDESAIFPLFRLSYHWITPVGVTTVMVVGMLVSLLTGKTDTRFMDPELISPASQWMLPPEAIRYEGSALRKARHLDQKDGDKVLMSIEHRTSTLHLKESRNSLSGST